MKLLSLLIPFFLMSCSATPEEVNQDRRSRSQLSFNSAFTSHDYQVSQEFSLHYMEAGTEGKPIVVFIHGTPGSWLSLARLMTDENLLASAHLFAIDRPGWGASLLADKRSEADFSAQADLIEPLLVHLKEKYQQLIILVGHSYGGSIAPYLAWRNPELIDGLLLAASAINPRLGKPRWYNWAASIWPVSRLIDKRLQIVNDEIWGVKDALLEMEDWWATTTLPIIYVQGEEDELVDPENFNFALQHLPKNTGLAIQLPKQGHLLHIQQRPLLAKLTLSLINALEQNLTLGELNACEPSPLYC